MSPHIWRSSAVGEGGKEEKRETHRDRGVHRDDIALFDQQLSGLVAELADLRLRDWPT
jgi:hypothetical protein